MKKTTYLIKITTIILILCALLSSCNVPNGDNTNQSEKVTSDEPTTNVDTAAATTESTEETTQSAEETTEAATEVTTEAQTEADTTGLVGDQNENENYKLLTQRDIRAYRYVAFSVKSIDRILSLRVPDDWSFKNIDNNSYTIAREGNAIGKLLLGAVDDSDTWQTVATQETNSNGFNMTENIEKSGIGENLKFRYRYIATLGDTVITITIDYSELSSNASSSILRQNSFMTRSDALELGTVTPNGNGPILIIGNSFISTSKIGSILSEMLTRNKKTLEAKAISRGMATVATYIADSTLMNEIKQGKYSVVFVCGLYSSEEINNLEQLQKICNRSKTPLVVFPAHNESSGVITKAQRKLSNIYVLNWKDEIDELIYDGRNRWDFCVDDYYDHSIDVAGYVGAQMIYRAIFGEVPTARLGTSISSQTLNTVLGDYVKTGYSKGTLYDLG